METRYILEDGSLVDPADVSTRDDGRLVHSSGALVALRRPDCPMTRRVDPEEYKTREFVADRPKRSYKTRQTKAR